MSMTSPSVALTAIIAVLMLTGCNNDDSRSYEYFAAHLDDARSAVAECTSGSRTGDGCENAQLAVNDAKRHQEIEDLIKQAKEHGA